ncbi:MAG: hypothetical protein IKB56_01990 [Clostridia bacterium]|nr:hypothetical protein [Clostridia bacterium]
MKNKTRINKNSPRFCKHCGKQIRYLLLEDYAYKYENKVFCSYSCLQAYKKKINANEKTDKILLSIKEYNDQQKARRLKLELRIKLQDKNLLKLLERQKKYQKPSSF